MSKHSPSAKTRMLFADLQHYALERLTEAEAAYITAHPIEDYVQCSDHSTMRAALRSLYMYVYEMLKALHQGPTGYAPTYVVLTGVCCFRGMGLPINICGSGYLPVVEASAPGNVRFIERAESSFVGIVGTSESLPAGTMYSVHSFTAITNYMDPSTGSTYVLCFSRLPDDPITYRAHTSVCISPYNRLYEQAGELSDEPIVLSKARKYYLRRAHNTSVNTTVAGKKSQQGVHKSNSKPLESAVSDFAGFLSADDAVILKALIDLADNTPGFRIAWKNMRQRLFDLFPELLK